MEKLLYALKNGELVSIEAVDSGLKCGCYCPACGSRLIAKKGDINIHHFAHESLSNCEHAYETSLHFLAKEIFKNIKTFSLPEVSYFGCEKIIIEKSKIIEIEDVQLEKYVENIKPDIIITDKNGYIYYVEIYVTHPVDNSKLSKIHGSCLNTIEIDLSRVDKLLNYEDLKEIILNDDNKKKWIYHTEIERVKDSFASEYAIPIRKLSNCIYQKNNNASIELCKHCEHYKNFTDKNIYCGRAQEVLAGHKLSHELKFCKECGCKMEKCFYLGEYYYICTGSPYCNNKEKVKMDRGKENKYDPDSCPECGAKLKYINWQGGFWGCSNYPKCSYTESIEKHRRKRYYKRYY